MNRVEFTIPGRPTAWQRAVGKNGVRFTPPAMRAAQRTIQMLCRASMRSAPPLAGPVKMEVLAVYAIPPSWPRARQEAARAGKVWKTTVPDIDNIAKQLGDALNGHAYADDAQIVVATLAKRYGEPERTEVRITALDLLCDHSPKGAFREAVALKRGQASLPIPSE